ncbi:MAG TPA: ribosome silencing factor [Candidatus Faeciplasma avium]|uniref:Ribosomal silencing factor RsfS n=1 Tax=Candidatus Faeciplasma avium TaxID=2840798 RepID=A0A9D1NPN0_9FIRM|nr:ribosome silencing factor [Candidatus Faeciplasma avium]
MTELERLSVAVRALDSKKAENIKVIKIADLTIIADYFIIANGTSSTHVRGLADEVEFKLGEHGIKPDHIEGFDGAGWIAMDYKDIIVHIFYKDARKDYSLEKLWSDGEEVDIASLL